MLLYLFIYLLLFWLINTTADTFSTVFLKKNPDHSWMYTKNDKEKNEWKNDRERINL